MTPTLSIVIPSYNSSKTLEEAVHSCFRQDLSTEEFEIIMVDDGSTDGTKLVMERLAAHHPNIRLLSHEHNRGGGAARNTGVAAAAGTIIYCLDSDNFFADRSVGPIVTFMKKHQLDGAGFFERRFFFGNKPTHYFPQQYPLLDRPIELSDLFTTPAILLDNFFFTKAAYQRAGGYPEHHDFDTQAYEMRFLAAGNRVRIVPGSVFYHRQAIAGGSYFEREYNKGNFSLYYYLCLEDIVHLFSIKAINEILQFSPWSRSQVSDNISILIKTLAAENYLFQSSTPETEHVYVKAIRAYRDQRYQEALGFADQCLKEYPDASIIYFLLMRIHARLANIPEARSVKTAVEMIADLHTTPQQLYRWYHRFTLTHRLMKYIKMIKS